MVVEAVQNYVSMVSGLSKTTRAKAVSTARSLLAQAGLGDVAADATERVGKLAEEILLASRANRELLEKLITAEVEKAGARLGFVRAEDVDALRAEVAELRFSLARVTVAAESAPAKAPGTTAARAAATKRTPAKRTPSHDSQAQNSPAEGGAAGQGPIARATETPTAKKAAVKKAAVKPPAAKTPAGKAPGTKVPGRKAAGKASTAGKISAEPPTPIVDAP